MRIVTSEMVTIHSSKWLFVQRANKSHACHGLQWDFLAWAIHVIGLAGHFGPDKTNEEGEHQFY